MAGVLDAGQGNIRDVVYFIGARPTRTGIANSFVAHAVRRRHAAATIHAQRGQGTTAEGLPFQTLEAEYVFNRLGDSLIHWQQLLTVRVLRSTRRRRRRVRGAHRGLRAGADTCERQVRCVAA